MNANVQDLLQDIHLSTNEYLHPTYISVLLICKTFFSYLGNLKVVLLDIILKYQI